MGTKVDRKITEVASFAMQIEQETPGQCQPGEKKARDLAEINNNCQK